MTTRNIQGAVAILHSNVAILERELLQYYTAIQWHRGTFKYENRKYTGYGCNTGTRFNGTEALLELNTEKSIVTDRTDK